VSVFFFGCPLSVFLFCPSFHRRFLGPFSGFLLKDPCWHAKKSEKVLLCFFPIPSFRFRFVPIFHFARSFSVSSMF